MIQIAQFTYVLLPFCLPSSSGVTESLFFTFFLGGGGGAEAGPDRVLGGGGRG